MSKYKIIITEVFSPSTSQSLWEINQMSTHEGLEFDLERLENNTIYLVHLLKNKAAVAGYTDYGLIAYNNDDIAKCVVKLLENVITRSELKACINNENEVNLRVVYT